ncbi:MAG: hypothetical protein IJ724_03885 [Muribaculaceae bacterium]|nr:hypothetical protein [Muribaculaceae bacterium]
MAKNSKPAASAAAAPSQVEAATAVATTAQDVNTTNSVSGTDTDNVTRTFVVAEIAEELAKASWSFGIGETYVRQDGVSVFVRDVLAPAVTGSTHTRYVVDVNNAPATYTNTGKSHMINGVPTCASPDLKALLTSNGLEITAQSARVGQKYGAKSPLTSVTLDNYEERATAAVNAAMDALAQLNKQLDALNKLPGLALTADSLTDDNKAATLAAVIAAAHTQAQNNDNAAAANAATAAGSKLAGASADAKLAAVRALAAQLGIDVNLLLNNKPAATA